ncbi:hypothetical protein [Megalodesulfovibrio gigas]|uniref:Uncharacterized protein n=1 Tax=Megalodesulfovibrio gigas (strain ATCC 19364 / DSM 1382 / NCIMB 9332 / VKM B-1759) TaxID=1121448 RepID=T2GG07_MEGG1|nr:hypothetical protein [Megalodesulfovibrio gigas]AGW14902.1 hypothetical protein DGI_3194 [Megalodesulfovibrio gigas DSM 1382 = ATCC 19364]
MPTSIRLILFITACWLLFPQADPASAQDVRRDKHFGTFHEGMRIESGPGQDTVIIVSPPPQRENQTGTPQGNDAYPLIIAPQINVPPRPPHPMPRTQ